MKIISQILTYHGLRIQNTLPASKFIEISKKRKDSKNLIFAPLETTPYPAKWEDRAVCLDDMELDKTLKNFKSLLDDKIKKNFTYVLSIFLVTNLKKQ